jgi:hypothetical protein
MNADGSNDRALSQPVPSSSGEQAFALSIAVFSPR